MSVIVPKIPRGIRSNNPGNIRKSSQKWLGKIEGTDPEFETFKDRTHGVRALAKILLTYYRKHKLNTVRAIISRWAPSVENDTDAYAKHVAQMMGVEPDDPIDLENELMLTTLTGAICRHENGKRPDGWDWIDAETLIKGVEMALET